MSEEFSLEKYGFQTNRNGDILSKNLYPIYSQITNMFKHKVCDDGDESNTP